LKYINKIAVFIFTTLISLYQVLLSPFLGKNCRFNPTCSEYSKEALFKYGVFKGSYLSIIRLLKCHPFSKIDHFDPLK